jgi:hypothetical protein
MMNNEQQTTPISAPVDSFQGRVQPWMMACFGAEISADGAERNHRLLEESLELVQACGCTASDAHQLVEYVYGRPVGERAQEVGGVMVTLAALCLAQGLDMHTAGETELARIWTKVEAIRAKQAAKPKHSPLPAAAPQVVADERAAFEAKHAGRFDMRRCPNNPKRYFAHATNWVWDSWQARSALAAAPVQASNPVEFDGIKTAPVQAQEPVAALMYMDELPAAQAGEKWIRQFAGEADKVLYAPNEASQVVRVKWCAYFDSYDRLVAAFLLTRDAKNWTQLTKVRGEAFSAPVQPVVPDGYAVLQSLHAALSKRRAEQDQYAREGMLKAINTVEREMMKYGKRAAPAAQGDAKGLTDDEIVQAVRSVGVDTHPSKFGFIDEQIEGMSVTVLRQAVAAIATKAAS